MNIIIMAICAVGWFACQLWANHQLKKEIKKQLESEFNDQIQRERLLMIATKNQTKIEIEENEND